MNTLLLILWIIINVADNLEHVLHPNSNSIKLSNETIITSDQFLMAPQWSPDDRKLLTSGEANNGIYVLTIDTEELTQVSNLFGSGYRPSWSEKGDFIYFRYKDQFTKPSQYETRTVFLDGKKRKLEKAIDPFTIFTTVGDKKKRQIGIKYNRNTLQVEGCYTDSDDTWLITSGKGQYYHPVLSPDRKLLLAHSKSKMYVFASDGSGLIAELGYGLGNTWSPNSDQIIYTVEESKDGHTILGAELYHTNLSGQKTQLTETPNRIENWPDWSANGKKLAFSDAASGQLIICDIEF